MDNDYLSPLAKATADWATQGIKKQNLYEYLNPKVNLYDGPIIAALKRWDGCGWLQPGWNSAGFDYCTKLELTDKGLKIFDQVSQESGFKHLIEQVMRKAACKWLHIITTMQPFQGKTPRRTGRAYENLSSHRFISPY